MFRRISINVVLSVVSTKTREEILKVSMAQNRVDASVNFTAITAELEGFTGSDIKEVGSGHCVFVFFPIFSKTSFISSKNTCTCCTFYQETVD